MIWVWLAGFGLFAIAAGGIWWSVTQTDYLPRLAVWLIKQALPIIQKRKSPLEEAVWREAMLRGQQWDNIRNRPKDNK